MNEPDGKGKKSYIPPDGNSVDSDLDRHLITSTRASPVEILKGDDGIERIFTADFVAERRQKGERFSREERFYLDTLAESPLDAEFATVALVYGYGEGKPNTFH